MLGVTSPASPQARSGDSGARSKCSRAASNSQTKYIQCGYDRDCGERDGNISNHSISVEGPEWAYLPPGPEPYSHSNPSPIMVFSLGSTVPSTITCCCERSCRLGSLLPMAHMVPR